MRKILFITLILSTLNGLGNNISGNFENDQGLLIMENKGQIADIENIGKVIFYIRTEEFNCFITEKGLFYQLVKKNHRDKNDKVLSDEFQLFNIALKLNGANGFNNILKQESNAYFESYFIGAEQIIANSFKKITIQNVYDGIDWVVYVESDKIKYDFIVHPGADINEIKIEYSGIKNIHLQKNGDIVLKTPLGNIEEKAPVSYYFEDNKQIPVKSKYKLNGKIVSFNVDKYPLNRSLIIDPILKWETTIGNWSSNGNSIATDSEGNVYFAGETNDLSDVSYLGFQNTKGGTVDAFLSKFDSTGTKIWSTYYGGTSTDYGMSVDIDQYDNVYLTGYTFSSSAISYLGFQNDYAGAGDAFIVKFNPGGARIWATYFGGPGADYANSISINSNDELYIAGTTESTSGIATGGFQLTYGTNKDCFVAKFDLNGNFIWSTYYGGSGIEEDGFAKTDSIGNLYLIGTTTSTSGISYLGFSDTYLGGANDAFCVKFNPEGSRVFGTYYGGTSTDYGYSADIDADGNLYLAGTTASWTGIAYLGHQNIHAFGFWDAFLVKFDPSGNRIWGTYYGGNDFDHGYGVATDQDNNVYLCGTSESIYNIFAGGFDPNSDDTQQGFLVKFDAAGVRKWGTYFGTIGSNYYRTCKPDNMGHVYLGGERFGYAARIIQYSSNNFELVIKNVVDSVYCSGDNMVIKFDGYGIYDSVNYYIAELSDADGNFITPYNIGENHLSDHGSIFCTLPYDLIPSSNYRVRVVSTDPEIQSSISVQTFDVIASPVVTITTSPSLTTCEGDFIYLDAEELPGLSYKWYKNGAAIIGATSASYQASVSGNYFVRVKNGTCDFISDIYTITILPAPVTENFISICDGEDYTLPSGEVVTSAGDYSVILEGAGECDSVVITHLTINSIPPVYETAFVCEGDNYILPDGVSVYEAGTYTSIIPSADGCDSTVFTTIESAPVFVAYNNITICAGESYILPDGLIISESGVYPLTYSVGDICINLITTLTVGSEYSLTNNITIYEGETYILPGGSVVSESGTYVDSLITIFGCDSVITTNLNVTVFSCEPPSGIFASDILTTSAKINWTAADGATKYDIYYRIIGAASWQKKSSTLTFKTISPLTANSNYEYKVRTVCGLDNSLFSTLYFFTTPLRASEENTSARVSVYPNPNNGEFKIDLSGFPDEELELLCFDITGKIMYKGLVEGNKVNEIQLQNGFSGALLLRIYSTDHWHSEIIIIEH